MLDNGATRNRTFYNNNKRANKVSKMLTEKYGSEVKIKEQMQELKMEIVTFDPVRSKYLPKNLLP